MTIALSILAGLLLLIGFVGCVLPDSLRAMGIAEGKKASIWR